MNRHEFEARTGWEVSDDDYAQIEKIYLNAGEMDKDEFCRDYAKGNGHEIMSYLSQKADDQRNHIRKLDKKIARLEEECALPMDDREQAWIIELLESNDKEG